jgi:prepilin-type N-terminal cleavage/methylation domain-containing protein
MGDTRADNGHGWQVNDCGQKDAPVAIGGALGTSRPTVRGGQAARFAKSGFSLIEVLVVSSLLALIVFALMSVFSSTQRAFRASVTQTDVLEGGKAAEDLICADLVRAAASKDYSFGTASPLVVNGGARYGVNFFVTNNAAYYQPLIQTMPASPSNATRTNNLQWFFVLSRLNTQWIGVGYIVNTASSQYLYPLYRYYGVTNTAVSATNLFNNFLYDVNNGCTNMSHVMDGVVHLVIRAYTPNGILMTNGYANFTSYPVQNTWFTPPYPPLGGEVGFCMSSNALPASVELQLGVLEDKAVQHAQAMNAGQPIFQLSGALNFPPQWTYLQGASGRVHLFRQRVTIQNVDPTIYQ